MNWFIQSHSVDISDGAEELRNRFKDGDRYVMLTHDECYIVEDWKTNHDPGDEDDGLQKAIERTVKALRSTPKPRTGWWGDEK